MTLDGIEVVLPQRFTIERLSFVGVPLMVPQTVYLTVWLIRIYEGAAGNLPDPASLAAAREVLSVARGCGKGDILVALISGGGSALLSCPVEGITVEEKREVCVCVVWDKGGMCIQCLCR